MKYLDVPQSGSRAAIVASRNTYGQYYRDRTAPTQSSSAFAVASRALMAAACAAWNALTDAQRLVWIQTSQSRSDSLGQETGLSGRALFIRQWIVSSVASPAPSSLPISTGPRVIGDPRVESLSAGNLDFTWTSTSPLPAGPWLSVEVTEPLTAGSMFLPGRRAADGMSAYFTVIQVVTAGFTTPTSITGVYNGRFGSGPTTGDRIGWRVRSAGARWFELARGIVTVA